MWIADDKKAPIRADEEKELFAQFKATNDRRIRDRFIMSVFAIACREARKLRSSGIPEDDLVQAAMTGATRAFDTYDPIHGRFNTYAHHWIRNELLRLVTSQRTIVSGSGYRNNHSTREARKAVSVIHIDAEPHTTHRESAPDASAVLDRLTSTPATGLTNIEHGEYRDRLRSLFDSAPLTDSERWVLENRWLSPRADGSTLQQLADRRRCTKEWIRRLEDSAFRKIRAYAAKIHFRFEDSE